MDEVDRQVLEQLPWEVHDAHRHGYHLMILALAIRDADGAALQEHQYRQLAAWRRELAELNAVVVYDWKTPDGFYLVPRLEDDGDLTRPPLVGEGEIS